MIHAKKSLGQNFLINPGILEKIIKAAELSGGDVVVEVGPGTGTLTEKLSENSSRVIAVEKDNRLIANLKEKFKNTNVSIIESDILKLDIKKLFENYELSPFERPPVGREVENSHYKVVGNIPYYLTSHLFKTIFESASWRMVQPELMVFMVQKEVAQRIMAKAPHMNLLALSVQFYSEPKIISYVSRGSFRPMPKVDSAIISLRPKASSLKPELKKELFKLIKTAFAGKRKQLKNTIGSEILKKSGIKPESRPEELSLEDWLKVSAVDII